MKKKPVKESTVVKNIRKSLDSQYPGFYFKVYGSAFQKVGIPDIVGLHKGKFIAIEVKAPGKEKNLTKIQEACIEKIKLAGGIAFMSSSPEHTIHELDKVFKEEQNVKTNTLPREGEKPNIKKKKVTTIHGSGNRKNTSGNRSNQRIISTGKGK